MFSMVVHNQSDVQITVDPCLQSESSFDEQTKDTKLVTSLPPTSRLCVKWTEKQVNGICFINLIAECYSHLFHRILGGGKVGLEK